MTHIRKKKVIDTSVLDLAYERINHAFDLYDSIDVSFSGGKDSTACLNLTLEVARQRGKLPLRVFFHDEEAIPFQTEEYVRRVSSLPDVDLEWYCLPVKHRNACSRLHPWWSPWDPRDQEKWVRPLPPEAITSLPGFQTDGEPRDRYSIPDINGLLHDPKRYGTVGMVMGIRAQESIIRTRAVSRRKEENYLIHLTDGTSQGNVWKVYPIYDWLTEDVWTAPKVFGWDYNRAYDVMDQMGIPPSQQRCSPAYGEEPLQKFHTYRECFPELWDKMSQRVPGANTAMLYARTEIYGHGFALSEGKPAGMTWEQFLIQWINKFAPQEAAATADSIRDCIQRHYKKTHDPILQEVPHPLSGISWKYLLNLAVRGDLKGRRSASMLSHVRKAGDADEELEQCWKRYQDARIKENL